MASLEERMAQLEQVLSSAAAPAAQQQATEYQSLNALFQGQGAAPLTARPRGMAGAALGLGEQAFSQAFQPFVNYQTAATGTIKYTDTGVIADPTKQVVLFPTHKAEVEDIEGSEEWLRKIRKNWSDEKFDKWRKKLVRLGYDTTVTGGIAESGGAALDVINGLREYHRQRYLNGGEPLAVVPEGGRSIKETVKASYDPVAVKEEVKSWGDVPFGEALDEGTANYFAERTMQLAVKLAKENKDWSLEQIQAGATLRAQKEFVKTPGVKSALQDAEDDEMDESLRDTVVSVSQLGQI